MANIRVDSPIPVFDGQALTFRSPADCSQITGLKVYYPEGETTISKVFQLADAHGNNVGDLDLFAADVVVKVILDTDSSLAFVQNADTNAYLESRFDDKVNKSGDTMTDNLGIANTGKNELYVNIRPADGGRHSVTGGYNNVALMSIDVSGDYTKSRALRLYNSKAQSNVQSALRLVDVVNGASTTYDILHTGNSNRTTLVSTETTPTTDGQINWTYG